MNVNEATNNKGQRFFSGERIRMKDLPQDLSEYNDKILTIKHFRIHQSKGESYFRMNFQEVDWYAYDDEIEKIEPLLLTTQKIHSLPSF